MYTLGGQAGQADFFARKFFKGLTLDNRNHPKWLPQES